MSPLPCTRSRFAIDARWKTSSAFTLVEILVTVAIIGVLAVALLPSVQVMRGKAQVADCMGNLRQIGIGMRSYANDHDGSTPKTGGGAWNQEETWGYQIWPYIYGGYDQYHWRENSLQMSSAPGAKTKKNVFRCPATRMKAIGVPTASVPAAVMSYGFNADPGGQSYNRNLPIKLVRLSHPSKTLMVIESSSAPGDFQGYAQFGLVPHSGGSDALFYDGHVEWRKYADVPKSATDVFWDGTQE